MHILKNRIIISLLVIFGLTYFWEFHLRPLSGPLYTAAVAEYKNRNYDRSLELLKKAYRIDPNDAAILDLMGWDYLKLRDPKSAEPHFRRSHRLATKSADPLLGYAYTEIALEKYGEAANLLKALREMRVETVDVHLAYGTLYRKVGRNSEAAREFQRALALDKNNSEAKENLREIYNTTGEVRGVGLESSPQHERSTSPAPAQKEIIKKQP